MKLSLNVILSLIAGLVGSYLFYMYVPLGVFPEERTFGTSITTINGSDTISGSRTTINNNFSALNTGKYELSDWYATTSATQITKVGTITTGTWNATSVGAQYGGTGSSTLSADQILLGNGTGIVKVVSGFGNSGQSLVSNGNGVAPSWQSVSFDTSLAYTNTGLWTFNTGGIIAAASSTINAAFDIAARSGSALKLNALSYIFPSLRGANESVLTENGSGTLSWSDVTTIGAGAFLLASTTDINVNDTTNDTSYATTTIAAGLLGTVGAVKINLYATTYSDSGNNNRVTVKVKLGVTTVCTAGLSSGAGNYGIIRYEMILSASSSAALQQCQGWASSPSAQNYTETTSAVDTSTAQSVVISAQWDGNDPGDTESFTIGGANITFLGR